MRNTQDDLRWQKTETLIQKTFRDLLEEMNYSKISVQKLADRAHINRKTFYLHYQSMDELLAKLQRDLIDTFLEPIKEASLPRDLEKVVRRCYSFSENADALSEKILRTQCRAPIDRSRVELPQISTKSTAFQPEQSRYLTTYLGFTLRAIYGQWVMSGRKEPMEDMIHLTVQLLSDGLTCSV